MNIPTIRLSSAADINPRLPSPASNTPVSFLKMADVDAERGTTSRGDERRFGQVAKGYTQFADGDLLVAKITPCFENGKIAQAKLDHNRGVGSTEFHVIRPDRSRLHDRFLLRFLRQPHIRIAGEMRMTGSAGQRRVPEVYLADLRIPLIPLDEQRQIAGVLDAVDVLRDKRRQVLAALDALAHSIFFDMFGDPESNPMGWRRCMLGEVLSRGPQNGLYRPSSQYGAGTPIVRIDSFYSGVISKLSELKRVSISGKDIESFGLDIGDILINRVNSIEYLGKVALVSRLYEPTVFESNMMRLSTDPRKADPTFVSMLLQGAHVHQQIRTAAKQAVNQASINQNDVRSFEIPIPPLPLQREFAERQWSISILKSKHKEHLVELNSLYVSLEQRAFQGTLRTTPA